MDCACEEVAFIADRVRLRRVARLSVYGVTSFGPVVMSCMVQAEVALSIEKTDRK